MATENTTPTPIALDADSHVAEDLPCIQCGYNLRTLHREAKCPECETAVSQSIKGNWLRHSDPAWLRKVSRGLIWIYYVFAVSLAFGTRVLVPPVFEAFRKAVG